MYFAVKYMALSEIALINGHGKNPNNYEIQVEEQELQETKSFVSPAKGNLTWNLKDPLFTQRW